MGNIRRAFPAAVIVLMAAVYLLLMLHSVSAHEVYVLNSSQISVFTGEIGPNPFSAIRGNELLFMGWGIIIALSLAAAFVLNLWGRLARKLSPFLFRMKDYAPLAARLTLGICFITSGIFGGLFGPEIPLSAIFGGHSYIASLILIITGAMITAGLFTRVFVLIALLAYIAGIIKYGAYMLTYINYLGEILFVLILGAHSFSLDSYLFKKKSQKGLDYLKKYNFLILRILFGLSLIFTSWYAKFLHSGLALQTVTEYHLTGAFPFPALFVVMGALIVESLIGLLFALGVDIRINSIIFIAFLTLSLIYFGEVVWPHIILFGVSIALFLHGYDEYTVEKRLFRRFWKKDAEPVF